MRGKARRIGFIASACMALVTLLGVAPTHAQTDHPAERLITELEMTDRILERAREVVEQSGNERAIHELKFAFTLQEQAKKAGTDKLTLEEIEAEIAAVRQQKSKRRMKALIEPVPMAGPAQATRVSSPWTRSPTMSTRSRKVRAVRPSIDTPPSSRGVARRSWAITL